MLRVLFSGCCRVLSNHESVLSTWYLVCIRHSSRRCSYSSRSAEPTTTSLNPKSKPKAREPELSRLSSLSPQTPGPRHPDPNKPRPA